MRPPWTRWRATHPQSVTRLPTSAVDSSPQKPVRVTHWRGIGAIGVLGLEMGVVEEEVEEEEEDEEEKMEVCLGSGLGKEGLRIRKAWDRRGFRGLERRGRRGNVLRRRDMAGSRVCG